MRAVVQRVTRASVKVNDQFTGKIAEGLLVLLGVAQEDAESDADYLAAKIAGLRIFEDEEGKMNRSLVDVGGAVLAVSQFTLFGDVRRGKRPSFDAAARPERANTLYEYFVLARSGRAAASKDGRFPRLTSPNKVNCDTARTAPPTSTRLRFILPSSSSKMRRPAILAAR